MSWKDTIQTVRPEDSSQSSWKDSIKSEPSKLESGARGLAQGATFGFSDEATGALEAAKDWLTNDPKGFWENYAKHRDESRANNKAAQEANPKSYMAGQLGGAVGTALVPGLGEANIAKMGAMGAAQGLGSSDADLTQGDIGGAARDTAIGGGVGLATGAALKGVSKIPFQEIANKISQPFSDAAEDLAVNATGATGKQAAEFAPSAGRELLDRGLVKFGDTAEKLAERTQGAMDNAGEVMNGVLKTLDDKGVKASADNVVSELQNKIAELSKDPSQAGVVRKLTGIVDDIIGTGESNVLPSAAEATKRGFNKAAGNWMDPEAGAAGKAAYGAYKNEVENAAQQADPALLDQFKNAKKTYGLLAPIQEAAEKRGLQQAQSPLGGMMDTVATGVGAHAGGPIGAIAGAQARRAISPRLASSGAVIADSISNIVKTTPQVLGKFAAPLQEAAARGGTSLGATHFVLQQTSPEYRELLKKIDESNDEQ